MAMRDVPNPATLGQTRYLLAHELASEEGNTPTLRYATCERHRDGVRQPLCVAGLLGVTLAFRGL